MKRRLFLKKSAYASLVFGASQALTSCEGSNKFSQSFRGKRLVIIKLSGGNDGLFTFFPRENDVLSRLRPTLYRETLKNSIQFQNDWHINYQFNSLLNILASDEIAILPYVGYPDPNMSHFKSTEIWDTAQLPGESINKTGWIGRILDSGKIDCAGNEKPVIQLALRDNLIDKGRIKSGYSLNNDVDAVCFHDSIQNWFETFESNSLVGSELKRYREVMRVLSDVSVSPFFPSTEFGQQLGKVTSMIRLEKPFKVFITEQSGYDTHLDSPKRLSRLYNDLSQSLSQFIQEMKSGNLWNDTLVFIYSEFGRTIDENANLGSDHGAAGLCMLLGKNTLVDRYSKITPQLQTVNFGNELYLKHQIDFRKIYYDIENEWLYA
jgi:uncharacterized protein (DUF1501 family)